MLGIFDSINTLDYLKNLLLDDKHQVSTKRLECYVNKLYNIPNASQVVTAWINTLINEYNTRYNDFDLVERSFYNKCFYKAIDYFIPFLGTYEKMGALINMCSLADDEDEENMMFHQEFFEKSVHNATKYENEISFLKAISDESIDNGYDSLYLLGFFNFRIQNYDMAIKYLEPCVAYRLKQINNDESIRLYIKSVIYLAESYEYKNDLDNALKQLIGIDGQQLRNHFSKSKIRIEISQYILTNYAKISKSENSIRYVKRVYEFLNNTSSGEFYTYKLFQLKGVNDSLKSFIHVLAHCISEYAAECMANTSKLKEKYREEIRFYSLLQQISRFLIDWLVIQDESYVTCQATIRAENDACPEAIDILIKRLKQFEDIKDEKLTIAQKMDKAELQFYIFYFAEQELNINNNKKNWEDIFEQYGNGFFEFVQKSGDTNALFHYLIIRFKYLLKKSAKDILQRNDLADYTELDRVYYKINESLKEPLPHVFRELIQECDRLIEAYLLLREYRYLDKDDVDIYNAQEFSYRLDLRKNNTMSKSEVQQNEDLDDTEDEEYDSNIIKTLIDEIEMRKRILILAPVKAAPSCSTDYTPISHLNKIVGRKRVSDNYESVHTYFQQVAIEHSRKKGINKVLQCENIGLIKWAIYYDSAVSALYLYYSEYMDGNKGEMIRANLNKNEKNHLNYLLESLKNHLFSKKEKLIDCSIEEHKRIYGSNDVCTTWLIKGSDVSQNSKVIEMLVFSEFDFYSSDHSCKIDSDDHVMFSIDQQYGAKYKIICFNNLLNTKEKGLCNYCVFEEKESVESPVGDLRDLNTQVSNNNYNCVYDSRIVDLNALKENIRKRKEELLSKGYRRNAIAIEKIESTYSKICKCCDNGCEKNNNEKDCEVLEICTKNGICIPTLNK